MPRQSAAALAVHMERVSSSIETEPASPPAAVEQAGGDPWSEPAALIRVLGNPSIDDAPSLDQREVEVLAFAACSGPSTDDEVSDAVFCGRVGRSELWNLLSGIRAEAPTLLAPRTEGGNDIALADGVMTDAQWMSRLVFRSHSREPDDAIADLVEALSLVSGVPFSSSTGFDWASTSGDLASAYEIVERCGYVLASRAIEAQEFTTARAALSAAIEALGANEPLTQALMRLEAAAGDPEAVESAYGDLSQGLAFISDARSTAEPAPSTTLLLTEPERVEVEATVEAPTAPVRQTVRPRVLLRTMGEVCAEGATTTQALAAAFVVAARDGSMASRDVAELTSYSTKSLSTVFTSSNELLSRENATLALRDGVWTDHGWMLECARRAEAAERADDVYDMSEWLRSLFAELSRVEAGPFASVPSKKAYWRWVDEFPADVPARDTAEAELVEATLIGVRVWSDAEASEHLPADVVVKTACKIASIAPFAPVADAIRPADLHTAAGCLLISAHGVAGGRAELANAVIATAHELVSNGKIEASDHLADALGL